MSLGTILGASFGVLRRNPRPTFGIALLIQAASLVVSLIVGGIFVFFIATRIASATAEDEATIVAGTIGLGIVTGLLTALFTILAAAILQGIIVVEVARGSIGEKLPLRGLWALAKGRIWALVGWTLILASAMVLAIALVTVVVVLMVNFLGFAGVVWGVLFAIFAGLAVLIIGIWLGTKLSLVPSALVLEKVSIRKAVSRSWFLTNDNFWRVFGIQLLVNIILWFASSIVTTPVTIIFALLTSLANPNSADQSAVLTWAIIAYIVQVILTVVVATITSIVVTATSSLLYLDLRMRKEGLDLHLTRFVEARQMGTEGTENPYLRPDEPTGVHPPGPTFA